MHVQSIAEQHAFAVYYTTRYNTQYDKILRGYSNRRSFQRRNESASSAGLPSAGVACGTTQIDSVESRSRTQ